MSQFYLTIACALLQSVLCANETDRTALYAALTSIFELNGATRQVAYAMTRVAGTGPAPRHPQDVEASGNFIGKYHWVVNTNGTMYNVVKTHGAATDLDTNNDIREVFSWDGIEARRITFNSVTSDFPLAVVGSSPHKLDLLNRTISEMAGLRTPFGDHGSGFIELFRRAPLLFVHRDEDEQVFWFEYHSSKYIHRRAATVDPSGRLKRIDVTVLSKARKPVSERFYETTDGKLFFVTTQRYAPGDENPVKWDCDIFVKDASSKAVMLESRYRPDIPNGARVHDERLDIIYTAGDRLVRMNRIETRVKAGLEPNVMPEALYESASRSPIWDVRKRPVVTAIKVVIPILLGAILIAITFIAVRARHRVSNVVPGVVLAAACGVLVCCDASQNPPGDGTTTKDLGRVSIAAGPHRVSGTFELVNDQAGPVVIDRITTTCGCLSASASSMEIGPGDTSEITVVADVTELGPRSVRAMAISTGGEVLGTFTVTWRGVYAGELRVICEAVRSVETSSDVEVDVWLYHISDEAPEPEQLAPSISHPSQAEILTVGEWRMVDAGAPDADRPVRMLAPLTLRLTQRDFGETSDLTLSITLADGSEGFQLVLKPIAFIE